MKYYTLASASTLLVALLSGCGGSSSGNTTGTTTGVTSTGVFLDKEVSGLEYRSNSYSGKTDNRGYFQYKVGEEITFKLGNTTLGKTKIDSEHSVITPLELVGTNNVNDARVVNILRVLQSADSDHNASNGITITQQPANDIIDLATNNVDLNNTQIAQISGTDVSNVVSKQDSITHFQQTLDNKEVYKQNLQDGGDTSHNNTSDSNDDGGSTDNNTSTGGSTGGGSTGGASTDNNTSTGGSTGGGSTGGGTPTANGSYTLLAWNDLGMHCMDGSDYSVFTILPPYNNLNAQLINKTGTSNKYVTSGVTLTYEAYKYNNHINTISSTKTNFWNYLTKLFPGHTSTPDVGLTGNSIPSLTPHPLQYNATNNWFEATALPIINRDDDNTTNYYPLVKVVAKDTSGAILADSVRIFL